MLRKCVILSLALLLVGGLAFGWVYNETRTEQEQAQNSSPQGSLGPTEHLDKYGRWYALSPEQQNQLLLEVDKDRQDKTREQLAQEQDARLRADLDKLAAGAMHPGDIADFVYGPGWEDEVEQYKKRKEQMEIAQTFSLVCLSIGGTLTAACIVTWLFGLLVRLVKAVKQRSNSRPGEPEPSVPELTDIEPHDHVESPQNEEPPQERPRQRRKVLTIPETPSGPYGSEPDAQESTVVEEFLLPTLGQRGTSGRLSLAAQPAEDSSTAVLLTDEPSQESEWSPEAEWSLQGGLAVPSQNVSPRSHIPEQPATSAGNSQDRASAAENSLKEQAEDLQKQIAEFKQVAQNVQQATREQSEPLGSTLRELTQQVSAIREYAANQQGRVEKLQDGYDWGIIRTFCLRVIRCLDNLENRIEELPDEDGAQAHLEEVRDELLFALESSGVEQFRPEINSEYKGLERSTEAIKKRQPTKKPDLVDKIAKVIRPGYRYMVDDENYKVVRTAQVKLFGATGSAAPAHLS